MENDTLDLATQVASALARRFEGLYLTPYLCPAGVPTIGYGATYYMDGTRVTLHDPAITKQYAESLLLWMVRTKYLPVVLKLCPTLRKPNQLAAIIDFTFNLGSGQLQASNLRRRINAQEWEQIPYELRKWVKGGGKVLKGLTLRREAEITVFQG